MKIRKVEKLAPNLKDKRTYVVYIRNLNQTLKVHQVIRFEQSHWMKPYIMLNTGLRTDAKNESEKDFFKLINKSVFGESTENSRNHKG